MEWSKELPMVSRRGPLVLINPRVFATVEELENSVVQTCQENIKMLSQIKVREIRQYTLQTIILFSTIVMMV